MPWKYIKRSKNDLNRVECSGLRVNWRKCGTGKWEAKSVRVYSPFGFLDTNGRRRQVHVFAGPCRLHEVLRWQYCLSLVLSLENLLSKSYCFRFQYFSRSALKFFLEDHTRNSSWRGTDTLIRLCFDWLLGFMRHAIVLRYKRELRLFMIFKFNRRSVLTLLDFYLNVILCWKCELCSGINILNKLMLILCYKPHFENS